MTGTDGKPVRVVEAGSAFAEVGLLSIPYKYDTNGTETTDDDMVTVLQTTATRSSTPPRTSTTFWPTRTRAPTTKAALKTSATRSSRSTRPLKTKSNKVLGTFAADYFYGEDAAGTHGWEMVRTTDFRPNKEAILPRPRPSAT